MAFPHALRHALAVAVLRGVAAHEAKACRAWGHPKEGKWQKDEDCCAGVEQAACAAGHRYVKGEMCHKEVECKAFSYECDLCEPGEECDTNYDTETEKGVDYDCKQNLWSACYFIWPMAWIFFYLAIRRGNILIKEGKQSEAKAVWIQTKWGAFGCVETNQCVGCTKSFLGDDAAVLARSSGEEPASPRHRAGVASMAWRTTR